MDAMNITTARANLYKLAQHTIDSHEPITLVGKNGNVVMMSLEDYENLQETIYVLQTMPDISKDAKKAKTAKKKDLYNEDSLSW